MDEQARSNGQGGNAGGPGDAVDGAVPHPLQGIARLKGKCGVQIGCFPVFPLLRAGGEHPAGALHQIGEGEAGGEPVTFGKGFKRQGRLLSDGKDE